ncbi:MAG: YraN family protein [Anaerolineales bacterium]|nr:YraN family protein [Anaerolineales bacterium]
MSDFRRRLGRWGENRAARHLQHNGYTIIERNYRCSMGEMDLITTRDDQWIFVEVKTRRGTEYGLPEEAITPTKAGRLLDISRHYLFERAIEDVCWRVDVIAVELDKKGRLLRIEHFENAVTEW